MARKLKIVVPLVLLLAAGGYKFVLAGEPAKADTKIHGDVYVLGKDFLVNLRDGRFAKLGVALVVAPGSAAPAGGGGHGSAAPKPPEGYGALPQEAVVRDIVTDTLSSARTRDLASGRRRDRLKRRIKRRIAAHSDVKIEDVYFTDVAVQ